MEIGLSPKEFYSQTPFETASIITGRNENKRVWSIHNAYFSAVVANAKKPKSLRYYLDEGAPAYKKKTKRPNTARENFDNMLKMAGIDRNRGKDNGG